MDPLSHGLIGLTLYASQNVTVFTGPACLGAVIGAMAPDLDIIAKIKGDYAYYNHHRVESHSIPGVLGLSLAITLGLSLFFPSMNGIQVFLWSLVGGLSHILFDFLNSYGVALLYPFKKTKYSLNLLMIYDPVLIAICCYRIFRRQIHPLENRLLVFLFILYLSARAWDQWRLKGRLKGLLAREGILRINVMPAAFHPLKWDFVVETEDFFHVGEITSLGSQTNFLRRLKKIRDALIQRSLREELGIYFSRFTPLMYIDMIERGKDRVLIRMTDLRYRIKNQFMHHALFYYCKIDGQLLESFFYPFRPEQQVNLDKNNQ